VETLDGEMRGTATPGAGPLRLLKVDVEGHELALFQGGEQTLRRDRPSILFECERRHLAGHTMDDVFAFLRSLSYRGYLLADNALLPVERFDAEVHQRRTGDDGREIPAFWKRRGYHNNFLFLPSETRVPRAIERLLRT
jgi:hypothetical protein